MWGVVRVDCVVCHAGTLCCQCCRAPLPVCLDPARPAPGACNADPPCFACCAALQAMEKMRLEMKSSNGVPPV